VNYKQCSVAADGLRASVSQPTGGMQPTGKVRPVVTFLRINLDHDTPWSPLLVETVFYREFQPVTPMVRVKTVQYRNGSWKYVFVSQCHVTMAWRLNRVNGLDFEPRWGQETCFTSPKHPDGSWGPPSLLRNRYWSSLPEIKRTGHERNHSPPPSAEVKNKWSYTSTPLPPHMPSWRGHGRPYLLTLCVFTVVLYFNALRQRFRILMVLTMV